LGHVPDRKGKHGFGIGRIDHVDEVIRPLRVVNGLEPDSQFFQFRARLGDALHMLRCPIRAERAEQNVLHGSLLVVLEPSAGGGMAAPQASASSRKAACQFRVTTSWAQLRKRAPWRKAPARLVPSSTALNRFAPSR